MTNKMRSTPITDEMRHFMDENYKEYGCLRMGLILAEIYGGCHSKWQIREYYRKKGYKASKVGRMDGNPSWMKGRKIKDVLTPEQYKRFKANHFQKGNSSNCKPLGTRRIDRDGYAWIKVEQPNKWQLEHVLLWEKTNGKIPKGYKLIHLDKNTLNNDLSNLKLISKKAHMLAIGVIKLTVDPKVNEAIVDLAELSTAIKRRKKNA